MKISLDTCLKNKTATNGCRTNHQSDVFGWYVFWWCYWITFNWWCHWIQHFFRFGDVIGVEQVWWLSINLQSKKVIIFGQIPLYFSWVLHQCNSHRLQLTPWCICFLFSMLRGSVPFDCYALFWLHCVFWCRSLSSSGVQVRLFQSWLTPWLITLLGVVFSYALFAFCLILGSVVGP